MSDIGQRKTDHIELCATEDVGFRREATLFECVRFVHDACPDLAFDELDTSVEVLGKRLRAPLFIAAMTGGTEEAGRINRDLASIAEERGYGFGLGSQRAMLRRPEARGSYSVREAAPTALLLGNIGVVQARESGPEALRELARDVGVDALCVHLNPAMELVQDDGDRDFRDGVATLGRLVRELGLPIVAKETGCGLSRGVGRRLREVGVRHVDVSGAGGTSWVAVETRRADAAGDDDARALGEALWDWGIPTAASVGHVAPLGFDTVIATGGVGTGLEVAKAIALGATAAGVARPVLRAHRAGGREGASRALARIERELRAVMLLTGSRDLSALQRAPRVLRGELGAWLAAAETP
ncbi:MAG: type 2 isopentenyl-diphosphate Delta-isomerase [Myxococcales bacterium]|jgi:isopentenyl-diphosphate delta-isomerase|nr:type 2 isopentenyl-diphosphate Delta-isomerase [Myxococcales bacterium]